MINAEIFVIEREKYTTPKKTCRQPDTEPNIEVILP